MTTFNAAAYLAANPDLSAAGVTEATAASHYASFGFSEGRPLAFDATVYRSLNSDLASLSDADALTHFSTFGQSENRLFNFDATEYKAANADLASLSDADALAHYVAFGVSENRLVEFDAAAYLAANTDLSAAGITEATALEHYNSFGQSEGRLLSFDADDYLTLNSDLSANGITTATALEHYTSFGQSEGRAFVDSVAVADSGDFMAVVTPVTFSLAVDDSTLVDEGTALTFTITPSAEVTEATELFLQITGSTVGAITSEVSAADFSSVLSSVNFAAGDSAAQTVAITVVEDSTTEGAEAYQAQLLDSAFAAVSGTALTGTINDNASAPQTFNLTSGADTGSSFTGAAGNDSFIGAIVAANATGTTFQSGDSLDGGAGTDSVTVARSGESGGSTTFSAITLSNIETVNISNFDSDGNDTRDDTFDASVWSGVTAVNLTSSNATGDTLITNLSGIVSSSISNGSADFDLDYTSTAIAGSSDTQSLALNNVSAGTINLDAGIEAVAITASGASSTITALTGTGLASGTVAADVDLDLGNALPTTLVTLDASASTAAVTVDISDAADYNLTGGSGNDVVVAGIGLTNADTIDGGAGTDVISTTSATAIGLTVPTTPTLTNFETLRISDALRAAVTAANIQAGLTTVDLVAGSGAQTLTLDAGTQTVTIGAANTGTLVIEDTGSADTDVLTVTNSSTTFIDVFNTQNLTVNGFETVTLNTGATANATPATGKQDLGTLTLTPDSAASNVSLTVTGANSVDFATSLTTSSTGLLTVDASGLTAQAAGTTTLDIGATSHGTGGTASITGSAGDDNVALGAFASTVVGGAGNDTLAGGSANDNLSGGEGVDTITDGGGNDTIDGGDGNDVITISGISELSVSGGAGNDVVNMKAVLTASDTVDGGDGTDTLAIEAAATAATSAGVANFETLRADTALTQDLIQFTTNTGFTTVSNNVAGAVVFNNASSTVTNFSADVAGSTSTVDRLLDNSSNALTATFLGGATTTAFTAEDEETLTITSSDSTAATITTLTSTDLTTLNITGAGKIVITNAIASATSLATIDASGTTGTVNINASNSTVDLTATAPSSAAATITGGGGNDSLTGSSAADSLTGGSAADTISGGAGADSLLGGTGTDSIVGGEGADVITGGSGNDTIDLTENVAAVDNLILSAASSNGADTITNFAVGTGVDTITFVAADTTVATTGAAGVFESIAEVTLVTAATYNLSGDNNLTTANTDVYELLGTNANNGDLSLSKDGTELLKLLGTEDSAATSITMDMPGDNVFLVAYDNGNAYIYNVQDQATGATAIASEILLVGILTGVAVGDVASGDLLAA